MRKRIYLMRPNIGKEEINLIKRVFQSQFLTEGDITKKFEDAISSYVHSKYAIATTSATTALHTVFHCIGIKGKNVLVSDFTFPATALAIIQAGGNPVLIDVDKETMNVNREIVEDSLDKKIKFIAPVSLFGNPLNEDFYKLKKKNVMIIEDAATNLGTKIGSKYVGTLADATCFSFHPRKIITTGEGGMITTNNKKLNEKFRSFKKFGQRDGKFLDVGTNYKLSDIHSSIGLAQLKKIEKIIKKRRYQAKIYDEIISKINNIVPQESTKNSRHTYQSYVCCISKSNKRDKIQKILAKNNIESQIGTYALHKLPAFQKCKKVDKLKNSSFLFENSITLPLHHELKMEEQFLICRLIKSGLR